MKPLESLLEELISLDVKLWLENGQVRCRAIQGKIIPSLRQELSDRKEEIRAFLQKNQEQKHPIYAAIPSIDRSELLPLSFAQERLWFLDQLDNKNVAYNEGGAVRLEGQLDSYILSKSVLEITKRHEILRTNFKLNNDQVCQIINEPTEKLIELMDLSYLSEQVQKDTFLEIAEKQFQTYLDLEKDELLKLMIIKLSDEDHILLVKMHHIICDGWSFAVFIRELSVLYNAYREDKPSPLSPLSIQYADYAVWQRKWLTDKYFYQQIDYWKRKLSNLPPLLDFPTDYPRPSIQSFKGSQYHFVLPNHLSQKLQQLSQQLEVTLFMVLLTGFSILLSRYSRQEDIAIGSPIANRNRQEIESLIGFFVNSLVFRINLENQPTVIELLKQVKTTCLEAYNNQDVPFEKLVEEINPERNLSYSPLFQVMIAFQDDPTLEFDLPSLKFSSLEIDKKIAKFDLTLFLETHQSELRGVLEYNTDLFERETIERMMGHFQVLLEGMVNNPEEKVSKLPLLTESERNQILVEWNDTEAEYPKDKCIHQLFEEQVLKTPEAVAVVYGEQELTYQQLNEKANQLGHYLVKLGVKPDDLVGICVERSLEMIVGLLGILKAGGAYVPIDPNYPSERIEYMIEDSGVSILLTQERLIELLPESEANLISLDKDWIEIEKEGNHNFNSDVSSENLAYVIYTSGSTGKPKGVLINHANVTRLFSATQDWYHFNEKDVWTLFHSYAFDFSVWELWGGLFYGGRVVIVPYFISRSPEEFYQLLYREKVTILNQTPSAFQQLIRVDEKLDNSPELNLRLVIFGGEALDIPSLKPWFDKHGDCQPQLINMYGITETTVHVTYRPITQADLKSNSSVIGCPIPDLQVYILDSNLQLVPIGVAGEMCVGGNGVGRGYLNRPELTEQKFILNPFNPNSSQRLYRSGDLARYLPNGDIEYLGRIDHQVKIRGFRIELGEIEALLSHHPDIRENVVIAREDNGNKRLIAYLVSNLIPDRLHYVKPCQIEINNKTYQVQTEDISLKGLGISHIPLEIPQNTPIRLSLQLPNQETPTELEGKITWYRDKRAGIELNLTPDQQETLKSSYQTLKEDLGIIPTLQRSLSQTLREYLKEKLPEYMIPSAFVILEKLPLTPNGKIDRKALPEPDYHWLSQTEDFAPPQTPQEEILAEIWSELLRLETISINSNFFELGGDSILTIQVVARARQKGLKITPKQLFEHQTIAQLALIAEPIKAQQAEQGLVTGIVPLTPIQHWFFEQNLPNPHHWNQSVLLEIDPNINLQILKESWMTLLEHHDALRLRFTQRETGWEQAYSESLETITLEEIDLSELNPNQQRSELENQGNSWQSSLNLEQGPLMRVVIFKLGNHQPHRLLIIIHHLAVDGISWRILLEDLANSYQQIKQNQTPQLPPKTTSYKQWGEKLIEYANSEAIKPQSNYWLSLANLTYYSLPLDLENTLANNTEASAENVTFNLSETETQALLQDVPSAYNTQINDILLTAFVQTFTQWTGQVNLFIDLEGHGREDLFKDIDISRTVGWFTSVFPVGLDLSNVAQNELGAAIKTIKEQLRKIPEKGISYSILRYLSSDETMQENLQKIPKPQVSFNYLGQFDQMASTPPLLRFASEASGLPHSLEGKRSHLIDINSIIVGGKLEITWTYSQNFHHRATVEQLGKNYVTALQSLIEHCLSSEAGGFTPSDFPEIELDQSELDELLAEL